MRILCLDGGSSSLRFAVYDVDGARYRAALTGEATGLGQLPGVLHVRLPHQEIVDRNPAGGGAWDLACALDRIWQILDDHLEDPLSAAGHRIVFGGPDHVAPARVDDKILRELEELIPVDRLHLRAELDIVAAVKQRFGDLPQVLCFDTAFHRKMPSIAKLLPLPRDLDPLLQRYGFHGLSYEYVLWVLGDAGRGRLIVAHLGNGASLCALRDGSPIDTTMGFSPLSGLMMGTRPGDIDPGALLFLLEQKGYDTSNLADLLNHRSGLLGVSGISASMQTLQTAASDTRAREAIDLFVYQLVKSLGAMTAVLAGLDKLVFTGGIGEHAPMIRSKACAALQYLGLKLDEEANARGADIISHPDSSIQVRVVRTDENCMIAHHVAEMLS